MKHHDLLLAVHAYMETDRGEATVTLHLALVCDADDQECLWRISVPTDADGSMAVTLTPDLLVELGKSHDKYYADAWDGKRWSFGATPAVTIPEALLPT